MPDPESPQPAFYHFDWVIIGYSGLMLALLAVLGRPLERFLDEIAWYAGAVALVVLLVYTVDEKRSRLHALVRLYYPVVMFAFFYRATGDSIFLLFDRFYDYQLTAVEFSIFGSYPTLYIDAFLLHPLINEMLSFCYGSYYLLIPAFALTLFFIKRDEIARGFFTATTLTFFLSYILFILYPVEGPRWHFAGRYANPVAGPIFGRFVDFVMASAAVHGGAMPSSHFGVALVILLYCFRYFRTAAWWLSPLVIGLGIGAVWGRFHYISDVAVGGLIGLAMVMVVWKYFPAPRLVAATSRIRSEVKTHHVS